MLSMPRWACQQDGAARGLIDAARFHANKAVLDEIKTANAIVMAKLVELGEDFRRCQF